MEAFFDVIVAGAGPAGSSVAAFLASQGASTLLIDKAHFPRDKVCGDGLAPKALLWLDRLGCIDEVLSATNAYFTEGDVFIDGRHVLTGTFPQNTPYPGFSCLLERTKLDHILVRNAEVKGARFQPGSRVKNIAWQDSCVVVTVSSDSGPARFGARLLVGADGANSTVSRAIGNTIRDGVTAAAIRGRYRGVKVKGSHIRLYFDKRFFPGYGWVFADDNRNANIGIGHAFDRNFPLKKKLREVYDNFLATDCKDILEGAVPLGIARGGWTSFCRPKSMVADRIMLVGDAANLADPINGGGIHTAMESACLAAEVALEALIAGDCSAGFLSRYENRWNENNEIDWRTGELLLCIAKNPNLRELYLYLITVVARVIKENPRFEDFCGGLFSGVTPARECICPATLFDVTPLNPTLWLSALLGFSNGGFSRHYPGSIESAIESVIKSAGRIFSRPTPNFLWGTEVLSKAARLISCYARRKTGSAQMPAGFDNGPTAWLLANM